MTSYCIVCSRLASASTAPLIDGFGRISSVGHNMYVAAPSGHSSPVCCVVWCAVCFVSLHLRPQPTVEGHGMAPHLCADDTQIKASCHLSDVDTTSPVGRDRIDFSKTLRRLKSLATCICTVGRWCHGRRLYATLVSTSTPTSVWGHTFNVRCRSVLPCFCSYVRLANWYRPTDRHAAAFRTRWLLVALVIS